MPVTNQLTNCVAVCVTHYRCIGTSVELMVQWFVQIAPVDVNIWCTYVFYKTNCLQTTYLSVLLIFEAEIFAGETSMQI